MNASIPLPAFRYKYCSMILKGDRGGEKVRPEARPFVERLNFIPRYAKEIAGIGQMRGCLDRALHEAGLLFEQELDYRSM